MSLLKIYQGQALQTVLQEIVSPVQVDYITLDQPEPDLLATLADLKALTPGSLGKSVRAPKCRGATRYNLWQRAHNLLSQETGAGTGGSD